MAAPCAASEEARAFVTEVNRSPLRGEPRHLTRAVILRVGERVACVSTDSYFGWEIHLP